MKVVILKNIKNIGQVGEVKEVAEGHARNFLIPQGLAAPATDALINKLKRQVAQATSRGKKELKNLKLLLKKISGQSITLKVKADDGGKLYGSVTPSMIASQLAIKGIEVPTKKIKITEAIKEVGEYDVMIKLDATKQTKIKVRVSAE